MGLGGEAGGLRFKCCSPLLFPGWSTNGSISFPWLVRKAES